MHNDFIQRERAEYMLINRVAISREWNKLGTRFCNPTPQDAKGFMPWGFDRISDSALDMMGWEGFDCLLDVPQEAS